MIGKEFAAEKFTYKDPRTGYEVIQLTNNGSNNYQLYITDNSFTLGDREIYFLSDRSSKIPDIYNFFKMDLNTGTIFQVTDEKEGVEGHSTKTPDSNLIVYKTGNKLKKLNTQSGRVETIFEEGNEFNIGTPFICADGQYLGVIRNENVGLKVGANYIGFKEKMFAIKKSLISLIYLDGTRVTDVYEDRHWLGHFQFAPGDNSLAMFCHEGPWNLVLQRIWLLDVVSGKVKPCFRQGPGDSVGHEFWTRDRKIFFDNRRAGFDGTITSNKTQATVSTPLNSHISGQNPYIGLANDDGEVIRTIEMPYFCNHYHANNDNSFLAGDEVKDIVLIDIRSDKPLIKKLGAHNTSWSNQRSHCHPTFDWSGRQVLFTSDRGGKTNLYLIDTSQCI
ncbi:MAG TPA: oligogalacturonate lyase family protein [Bacillota bacterium]|nr:oligogalacturonate lyase family protein [Bacillota bacterium]